MTLMGDRQRVSLSELPLGIRFPILLTFFPAVILQFCTYLLSAEGGNECE